jgi:dipeptidyl aminopeptidase/acylaminoacyl peptidase
VTRFGATGPTVDFVSVDIQARHLATITSGVLADYEGELGIGGYTWLRDGRFVFAKTEAPPNASDLNLWSVRCDPKSGAAQGRPARLTSWTGFQYYVFSETRDGRLAVARLSTLHQIFTAELRNGGRALSVPTRGTEDEADDTDADWSPDSKGFVFVSNRRGNYDIYLQRLAVAEASWAETEVLYSSLDLATGKESFLLRLPRSGYWLDSISPDGSKIVRFQGPPGKIELVDLGSRSAREIALEKGDLVSSAAWTSGGDRLILSMQKADGWAIVSSDLEGRCTTLWQSSDRWLFPRFLRVSPDGQRLLFDRLVTSGNVWLIEGL